MTSNSKQALEAALQLAKQGLPCFPCAGDKRPMTPHGYKDAVVDPGALAKLWHDRPGVLVGIPTGKPSGLDVLDLDVGSGGGRWFAANRNRLPPTRTHRTRSGGLHLLFEHRAGVRCSAGQLAVGVDVRGDGGYVIWWPTTGLAVLAGEPPAAWPHWLLPCTMPAPRQIPRALVPNTKSLTSLIRTVAQAPVGQRNNLTFWAGCRAAEMVASGLLTGTTAAVVIAEAGTRAGLPFAEAYRAAISGLRTYGGHRHG